MKLSVLMPSFNEKDTLLELLQKVRSVPVDMEIILIDDASTDGTRQLIQKKVEGRHENLKVIYHEKNLGKGSAIRSGLKHASGEVVIIQDADLEYDPQDYLKILKPFEANGTCVVYGTRFQGAGPFRFIKHWFANRFLGKKYEIKRFDHFFGIQFLNFLVNTLYGAAITDEATCYKAFRREIFDKISLRCVGFEFCPEVTAKVLKAGYKITEVPISYRPRSYKEGKKLNWRHGVEAISALIKYRFVD